jgi:SAM-dependent methyltransferase
MSKPYDNQHQFRLEPDELLAKLDFLNWHRYAAIIKVISELRPSSVLEIGPGEGVVKRILDPFVPRYETLDINKKLSPDHLGDVREFRPSLEGQFETIIAADILEHIPFEDLEKTLLNIHRYLKPNGQALISIPHRASYFLLMTPSYKPRIFRLPGSLRNPKALYRRLIKRRVWIDPDHQWEVGDGKHKIRDVKREMKKANFTVNKRQKLLYVDFWTLQR